LTREIHSHLGASAQGPLRAPLLHPSRLLLETYLPRRIHGGTQHHVLGRSRTLPRRGVVREGGDVVRVLALQPQGSRLGPLYIGRPCQEFDRPPKAANGDARRAAPAAQASTTTTATSSLGPARPWHGGDGATAPSGGGTAPSAAARGHVDPNSRFDNPNRDLGTQGGGADCGARDRGQDHVRLGGLYRFDAVRTQRAGCRFFTHEQAI
jgi:hypothetical protein